MTTKQKFLTGIILGAAAGAGLAFFLQTEKGKEVMAALKEKLSDLADQAGDTVASKWHDFDNEMSELMKKGKNFVAELEQKAKDATT